MAAYVMPAGWPRMLSHGFWVCSGGRGERNTVGIAISTVNMT